LWERLTTHGSTCSPYVVIGAYAQGFARAGFSDEVEAVRTAYASGDRAAAVAGVSDRMLDAISIVGDEKLHSPAFCPDLGQDSGVTDGAAR
jgi:hypothetical protein